VLLLSVGMPLDFIEKAAGYITAIKTKTGIYLGFENEEEQVNKVFGMLQQMDLEKDEDIARYW